MRVDPNTKEVTLTEIEYQELINRKSEVDLEKEFKKWWEDNHNGINVEHSMYWYMEKCAEHFFERGKNVRSHENRR